MKVDYREGECFAVPLRDSGFGAGVIARANPKAAPLGYFFGPRREQAPTLEEMASLKEVGAEPGSRPSFVT